MASQFARRAASRRTSSLGDTGSSLRVLAKAKSSFVAEPMIPLVDKRFVDVLEERKTSMIPTSYIDLRHGVSKVAFERSTAARSRGRMPAVSRHEARLKR